MPYCDPDLAMVVTLPVPMVYPIQKIPGPTSNSHAHSRLIIKQSNKSGIHLKLIDSVFQRFRKNYDVQ